MRLYLLVIPYWLMPLHAMNPHIPPVYFIPPASYQPPYIMPHYQQPLYYPPYYAPLQYPVTGQNYVTNNTHEHLTSESSPSQSSSNSFSSDITSSDDHDNNHGENVIKIIDETIETITAAQEKYAHRSQYRAPQPLPPIPLIATQQHANSETVSISAPPASLENITLNPKAFRAYPTEYRSTLIGAYLHTKYPYCSTCHKKQIHYYNQVVHAIKVHKQCIECPNLPRYRTTRTMVQHLRKYHPDRFKLIEVLEQRIRQIEG